MGKLIQNAVHIPEDDTFIVSTHRHDYVTHTFKDGSSIAVDGGLEYARRAEGKAGDLWKLDETKRYEEYCLADDEPFGWIADRLLWGTRGKDGTEPLTYRTIQELAYREGGLSHMYAILDNATPGPWHTKVIEYWIDALTGQPS